MPRTFICVVVAFVALLPVHAGDNPVATAEPTAEAEPVGLSADGFFSPDAQSRRLIESLLDENPNLGSAWATSRADFQKVRQARSLPDPSLRYRYFVSTPETRVGPQIQTLELSQDLPWGGKRKLQAERAENLAHGTTREVEALERSMVATLKQAYFEAAYLQEALTINAEERELLRRFEGIALTRYATGEGIQQTVIRIQTDISRLGDRETELRQSLDAVVRRIAELIGRPGEDVVLHRIALATPEVHYDIAELETIATAAHPRVQAVEHRIEADRSWSKRRKLESRPDFRVGLGYTQVDRRRDPAGTMMPPQDNGKDIVALSVGITIPIFGKRNKAGVAEASESQRANEDLLEAVQNRLRFEIQEATLRLDAAGERSRLYRDVIVPQAEASLASAEAAYTTNRQGILDLLDAERILFQARLFHHRLIADCWIALTDLELALGRPFPEIAARTEPESPGAAS